MKKTNNLNIKREYFLIAAFFLLKILIHLVNPEYGYHRDELFFLYISDNYSFANLDVLPLTPLYLKLVTLFLGTSIKAIHFASGLIGAVALVYICLITIQLGGKQFAIVITGLTFIFSGFLIFSAVFTYDSLDFLCIVAVTYYLVRLFKDDNPRYWLPIGVITGFGLLNKMTILFFIFSVFIALLFVRQRKYLLNKWVYIAACITLVFAIPFFIWQVNNNWYFVNWANNYAGTNSYIASFSEFIWNQLFPNNIVNALVWLPGFVSLLFLKRWNKYRFFAYMYITAFLTVFFLGGKFYFLIPYYAVLLVVGAIQIEKITLRFNKRIVVPVEVSFVVIYIILGVAAVPFQMPLLSVKKYTQYIDGIGMVSDAGVRYENNQLNGILPQHFSDRFGWEEMTAEITEVYKQVTKNENIEINGILCNNSGQAAAINFFRDKNRVPEAISAHGWFFYHAREKHTFGKNYISIYENLDKLRATFHHVDSVGFFTNPYCMPYENDKIIYLCKTPKTDLKKFWETIKH